jgi:hypothetical protein
MASNDAVASVVLKPFIIGSFSDVIKGNPILLTVASDLRSNGDETPR